MRLVVLKISLNHFYLKNMPRTSQKTTSEKKSSAKTARSRKQEKIMALDEIFTAPNESSFQFESESTKKNSGSGFALFNFFLLICFLAVLGVAGWFYYDNYLKDDQSSLEPGIASESLIEEPIEQPQEDPIASWNSYESKIMIESEATTTTSSTTEDAQDQDAVSSTKPLFSFKYPQELILDDSNEGTITLSDNSTTSVRLLVTWKKTPKDLNRFVSEIDKINETAWEGKPSVSVATSTDQAKIGGQPAIFRVQKLLAADLNEYKIYFKAHEMIFSISLSAPELNQNILNFYLAFLDNFKF